MGNTYDQTIQFARQWTWLVVLLILTACDEVRSTDTAELTTRPTLALSTRAPAVTSAALDCRLRPELPAGSAFIDDQDQRSDLRSEPSDGSQRAGIPLTLAITLYDTSQNGCNLIEAARVDIWQADVDGHYSGVAELDLDTTGQTFLRGYQLTDANGSVQFQTIYPGWHPGRAGHIHVLIRTPGADGQEYQFTTQFFFDETITDGVYAQQPYAAHGPRDTLKAADPVFAQDGRLWLVDIMGDNRNGYVATMDLGLDLADAQVGAADSGDQPGSDLPQ